MDSIAVPEPLATALSAAEQALRDRFVAQYLLDYDEYKAAIRIGYTPAYAKEFSKLFNGTIRYSNNSM